MTFKPSPCPDRWHGVLAMLVFVLLDVILVQVILNRPVDGLSFVLALVALGGVLGFFYIGYRTAGAFTLEYWVDRDAVTLVWGPTRQIVPIGQIERVLIGTTAQLADRPRLWHWPCPDRRRGLARGLGVVNGYATCPLAGQVILKTAGESYGLSPADSQAFVDALQTHFALGVARPLQPELRRPPLWTWPLWRDRVALGLIGLGLLGLLLMFGTLCYRFPELSSDLPLHFDVMGLPDRIGPKSELFVLPVIGLIAWLVNLIAGIWLYRRVQQGAAYLLWGGAVAVQVIAGLALFNLMRW